MIVLKELARLLNEERLQNRDLSIDPWSSPDKAGDYFRALLADRFPDEDSAAKYYYQSDRKSTAYQKLKAKLKRILLGRVFLLDFQTNDLTDRARAFMECHRTWAAAKILIGKNRRQPAVRIAKQLLRQTQRYEFTELTVDLIRFLRMHYGVQEGDFSTLEQYNKQFNHHSDMLRQEDLAEEYYIDVISRFVYRKTSDVQLSEKAKLFYEELKPHLKRYESYRLHVSARMIAMFIHSSINDYPATISVCESAIEFFKAKKYQAHLPLQLLYQQLVVCYTQLKQYDRAGDAAEQGLQYLIEGSFNWFKHQEQCFRLYMHTDQYERAFELWQKTTAQRSFRKGPAQLQEMWRVFEAYLHYLNEIGELNVAGKEIDSSFRLGKFLNQTPRYSQDKRGMNIPILIIQILFNIESKEYNAVIDRIEAIEKYCSRYLKKGDMLRSNCFIKMLLQIPDARFHREAVIRKTDRYWQRLQSNPIDLSHQTHEIEIIPYEKIWGFVLDRLNKTFHRPRSRSASKSKKPDRVME